MRRGVILIVVMGITLVLCALGLAAVMIMSQGSLLTEHKIKRIRSYYAVQAGIIDAFEQLRKGLINPTIGSPVTYQITNFGQGIPFYPSDGTSVVGYTITITAVAKGDAANGCPVSMPSDYCITSSVSY